MTSKSTKNIFGFLVPSSKTPFRENHDRVVGESTHQISKHRKVPDMMPLSSLIAHDEMMSGTEVVDDGPLRLMGDMSCPMRLEHDAVRSAAERPCRRYIWNHSKLMWCFRSQVVMFAQKPEVNGEASLRINALNGAVECLIAKDQDLASHHWYRDRTGPCSAIEVLETPSLSTEPQQ